MVRCIHLQMGLFVVCQCNGLQVAKPICVPATTVSTVVIVWPAGAQLPSAHLHPQRSHRLWRNPGRGLLGARHLPKPQLTMIACTSTPDICNAPPSITFLHAQKQLHQPLRFCTRELGEMKCFECPPGVAQSSMGVNHRDTRFVTPCGGGKSGENMLKSSTRKKSLSSFKSNTPKHQRLLYFLCGITMRGYSRRNSQHNHSVNWRSSGLRL
eukprot:32530_1